MSIATTISKESIVCFLESFVVGNDVRHWPILICKMFTDKDGGGNKTLKEVEEHCQKRHMLNA